MKENVVLLSESVDSTPTDVASFLHRLANRIEAAEGNEVLIGLWSTGFGEDWEACFQVVLGVMRAGDGKGPQI